AVAAVVADLEPAEGGAEHGHRDQRREQEQGDGRGQGHAAAAQAPLDLLGGEVLVLEDAAQARGRLPRRRGVQQAAQTAAGRLAVRLGSAGRRLVVRIVAHECSPSGSVVVNGAVRARSGAAAVSSAVPSAVVPAPVDGSPWCPTTGPCPSWSPPLCGTADGAAPGTGGSTGAPGSVPVARARSRALCRMVAAATWSTLSMWSRRATPASSSDRWASTVLRRSSTSRTGTSLPL